MKSRKEKVTSILKDQQNLTPQDMFQSEHSKTLKFLNQSLKLNLTAEEDETSV